MIAFIDNPECLKNIMHFAVFVLIILVFGFIGGLGRASLESIKDSNFKPDGAKGFIKHGILGITGAGVFVFIAILLSKYNGEKFTAADVLFFTCISTSGGVLALGIIDAFAEKVKNDWLKMKNEVKDELVNELLEYNKIINDADVAIDSNDNDIGTTLSLIKRMEKMHKMYKTDYQFCVRLGILYRIVARYDDAIRLLRQLIRSLLGKKKLTFTDNRYIAVSFLNIACYHSLKMTGVSDTEKCRLFEETQEALSEAMKYDTQIKENIETDPHLKNYRDFKKTFDKKK